VSYTTLVDSQLRQAFNKLKDLAKYAEFKNKTASEYDFSTGVATDVITSVFTKIVILEEVKDKTSTSLKIMFKSKDVGMLAMYSTIIIEGVAWRVTEVIKGSGYINIASISKVL
jgi:hypothetical protein